MISLSKLFLKYVGSHHNYHLNDSTVVGTVDLLSYSAVADIEVISSFLNNEDVAAVNIFMSIVGFHPIGLLP